MTSYRIPECNYLTIPISVTPAQGVVPASGAPPGTGDGRSDHDPVI